MWPAGNNSARGVIQNGRQKIPKTLTSDQMLIKIRIVPHFRLV